MGHFDLEAPEVISAQVATESASNLLSLALQTEEGVIVRVRMAQDAAQSLACGITDCVGRVADTETTKKIQ
jgi:hypothetical protein